MSRVLEGPITPLGPMERSWMRAVKVGSATPPIESDWNTMAEAEAVTVGLTLTFTFASVH